MQVNPPPPPHHINPVKVDQTDSDQQERKNISTEKGKKPKKVKKGKNTKETDLLDGENCETKTPSTQSVTSDLPTRYTDGKLDIAEMNPKVMTTGIYPM